MDDKEWFEWAKVDRELKPIPVAPSNCPRCDSTNNSKTEGGNERCFHCGDCWYLGCFDPGDEDES